MKFKSKIEDSGIGLRPLRQGKADKIRVGAHFRFTDDWGFTDLTQLFGSTPVADSSGSEY